MTRREFSYGVIALKKAKNGCWKLLLVKHGKGHWGFPKGHAEAKETAQEAAYREFEEETGLKIKQILEEPFLEESYFFKSGQELIHKTVRYFFANAQGRIRLQKEEISDSKWVVIEKAAQLATFKETKTLCQKTDELLRSAPHLFHPLT